MKSPSILPLVSLAILALAPAASAAPRVVECGQPIKSPKRGVCANKLSPEDFRAFSPTLTWWYSWHYEDTSRTPPSAGMEFLPMAWGNREVDVSGLDAYLTKHKPSRVLAINEPNLKDQAFITPEECAVLYKKIKAVADKRKIPVIGPHMALGSPEAASITALDPIENKKVTYTFMNPYLDAVYHFLGDTEVPAVASHTYGNFSELKWMIGSMHEKYKRPVWVTEFAFWGAPDMKAAQDYLIQSVDLMERTPYVEAYAWFKERADKPEISLLEKEPGKLSLLGETYVNMPVHDPEIYYALPGRLQSENYVTMKGGEIALTNDKDGGFLEMQVVTPTDTIDYQVSVKTAGRAQLQMRFAAGKGTKVEVLSGENVMATAEAAEKGWQTVSTEVTLPAGLQTLQVRADGATKLNWLEFGK